MLKPPGNDRRRVTYSALARIEHEIDLRLQHIARDTGYEMPEGLRYVAHAEWSYDERMTVLHVEMWAQSADGQEVVTASKWGSVRSLDREAITVHTDMTFAAIAAALGALA